MMEKNARIFVAGHTGMVGSALMRRLTREGYSNLIIRTYKELDLKDQHATDDFFRKEKPEYVFLAAAKVGGIIANNTYRADFLYDNLQIQNNVIHCSWKYGVKKLLFLGSSCIYPKLAPQPINEESLLTSELEYTNEPYAIAKIAGIKLCESFNIQYGTDFISVMPTNLYGPNDNYDLHTSHVLPALIRKMHLAHCLETGNWNGIKKDLTTRPIDGITGQHSEGEILEVLGKYGISASSASSVKLTLWGTGTPLREFMHADDLADACVFIMQKVSFKQLAEARNNMKEIRNTHINIGTGKDQTIRELAEMVKSVTGFKGEILWDHSKPDGTPRKLLDVSRLHSLGYRHIIDLPKGIRMTYTEYLKSQEQ